MVVRQRATAFENFITGVVFNFRERLRGILQTLEDETKVKVHTRTRIVQLQEEGAKDFVKKHIHFDYQIGTGQ